MKCEFCGKNYKDEWWHNVVNHNMPLNWGGETEEEIINKIKKNIGYLADSIEIKIK